MTDAERAALVAVHIATHPDDPAVQDFARAYLRVLDAAVRAAAPPQPGGVQLPPPAVAVL